MVVQVLGTYTASMATGDINMYSLFLHTGIAASVDTIRVSIADTASGSTGIGTQFLGSGVQDIAFHRFYLYSLLMLQVLLQKI